jgi:hypothetical protein
MNQTSSFLVFKTNMNMTFCVDKYRSCTDIIASSFTLTVLFGKSEGKDLRQTRWGGGAGGGGLCSSGCYKKTIW